jgi:hypothetical protein
LKARRVPVQLTGEDGNAYFIIGRCQRAAKRAGATPAEVEAFAAAAMGGDYDHLLRTVLDVFDVDGDEDDE